MNKDVARIARAGVIAALIGACPALAAKPVKRSAPAANTPTWRTAWGSVVDASDNGVPEVWLANHESPTDASSPVRATYRLVAQPTVSGEAVRLRFSNHTGDAPLTLADVSVGSREPQTQLTNVGPNPVGLNVTAPAPSTDNTQAAAIEPGTLRHVTFNGGLPSVTIRQGDSVWSDPVTFPVQAFRDLAVSLYVPRTVRTTSHHNSCVAQYLTAAGAGDRTADTSGAAFSARQEPLPWLDAISVDTPAQKSVVAIGDSVTDGVQFPYSSDNCMNLYTRYPDYLAQRTGGAVGWVNEGLGADTAPGIINRLQHDALDLPGVTAAIVEIGINDLAGGATGSTVIANLKTIYGRLHQAGLRVTGVTLPPSARFFGTGETYAAARDQVNQYIRTTTDVDAVIDLARTVGLAQNDDIYQPPDDSGDGLHPSTRGYYDIAGGVDLRAVLGGGVF